MGRLTPCAAARRLFFARRRRVIQTGIVRVVAVVLVSLCAACASRPRPVESPPPARVHDSVPERAAATRAAARLDLEQNDERWAIEAAEQRKREGAQAKTGTQGPSGGALIPMPTTADGGTDALKRVNNTR